jgi:CDP-glucose 4,6-dehydratase
MMTPDFWLGKSVFLTGHTGFKGGWLALWLASMGAHVHGYALAAPTDPNFFSAAKIQPHLASHTVGDIRDAGGLAQAMQAAQPDIVFHLAAQPLVRSSYHDPVATYATNVMGTVNLLEAVRACQSVRAVVNVTTDKCYENKEWVWSYRENEPMGGRDPYSSSKACAELVSAAYRDSFLSKANILLATARAGNVIGGGDWALDRLVPDFFRAAQAGQALEVRFPNATRPWQHVLEPLCGYLTLAQQLHTQGPSLAQAWNFGPKDEDAQPVQWLLEHLTKQMPGTQWRQVGQEHLHEAGYLKLDSSKAQCELHWAPRWSLKQALQKTVEWHQAWVSGTDMHTFSLAQISAYLDSTTR